jgi:two-component system cell cycle response regulator
MKPTILIVDDNEDILEFLTGDLSPQYSVIKARNGTEALPLLANARIHLIISDVMMPGMDGFELCRLIKSDPEVCHIPVILLTAKSEFDSKINGLELGADAYIDKPFSPVHLHVQISNLLTNRNKVKEHFANSPLAHIKSMADTETDELFLEEINNIVLAHIEDPELDVEKLAGYMNMSRPTLYRKLKSITDLTPNEVINISRLKKAAILLSKGKHSINEIAELVGYTSPTHFGRNFQKQFGINASEFRQRDERDKGKKEDA